MNLLHKFDLATNTEPNLWKPLSCQNFGNSANDNRYVRSSSKVELFMYRTQYLFGWTQRCNSNGRRIQTSNLQSLKGQCPDYAHARASSVFSSKDNRTVILTRQDFLPDRTADRDLLFIFSSNILGFQRSLSSYIKIWLAVRRLSVILSLAGPPRDPKISFRWL